MSRVALLLAVLAAAGLLSLWWRAREGRVRSGGATLGRERLAELGATPGRLVLLELTAPGCAPCLAARRVLDDVAAEAKVDVLAVDVGEAQDIARANRVLQAPTTLLVAPDGTVSARISGVPDRGALLALLGAPVS